MKKITTFSVCIVVSLLTLGTINTARAQCSAAVTNWDYLDYLLSTGLYAGYVSPAMASSQNFAIGPSYFSIATTGVTLFGDTSMHTGEVGAYGTGEDIRFTGAGTITITFKDSAQSIFFTLFDLDNSQVARFTATSPTGISRNITLGGTGTFAFAGNGGTSPTATPNATNVAVTANTRNLNFSVAGTVKTIVITLTGAGDADGLFLSDIRACVPGSFPTNYYEIARPFTGMPAFGLATSDTNIVHVLNLSSAVAGEQLVRESGYRFINSTAYDPYMHRLFYVEDGSLTPATNRALRYFDYDTETYNTLVNNVTSIGIPVFDKGVQSAAATYYGGQLYFGVEANAPATTSPRENIIWRIELDTVTLNILSVCQVYAQKTHTAGSASHDWGDITIRNGLMYDFDAVNLVANSNFYHYNLQNDSMEQTYVSGAYHRARQTAQRWDGVSYNVWDSLSVYNNNGTLGAKTRITGTGWRGTCGDATGPFKPKTDFGDAPASYDPTTGDPATHLRDTALYLGGAFDREWAPMPTIYANGDGADEDGISVVSVLATNPSTFSVTVSVYNNTGSTARLVGWVDFNENGVFNSGEGISVNVNSMAAVQSIALNWTGISAPGLVGGDLTYIRIRISTDAGLTTATPNGYFNNGEVEDYPVVVDVVLPTKILSFDAYKHGENEVKVNWQTITETGITGYEIEHSSDGANWKLIGQLPAQNSGSVQNNYSILHRNPLPGKNFYRMKINETNNRTSYSSIKTVNFNSLFSLQLQPNPAVGQTTAYIYSQTGSTAQVRVNDMFGRNVWVNPVRLAPGHNRVLLNNLPQTAGTYTVQVWEKGEVKSMGKLVIQ